MSDPSFVASSLKEMGAAGAAISVLLTAVTALAGAVVIMWKSANTVNAQRLAERDTLNKALSDSSTAINSMNRVIEDRNRVTEELADAMSRTGVAFEVVKERMTSQHEANKEKLASIQLIIESFAESHRALTAICTDIRNFVQGPFQPTPPRRPQTRRRR